MANVTNDQGKTQTPEQMAAAIIKEMEQPLLIEIPGMYKPRVETIVRYLNRDKISARGEVWFKKNYESLLVDCVSDLIKAREKAIVDYLAQKEQRDKDDQFRKLISRGVAVPDAYKQIYS